MNLLLIVYWAKCLQNNYNFGFNNENKQILFYKKINNGNKNNESGKSHKLSNGALIAIISIVEALIFILAGIVLG